MVDVRKMLEKCKQLPDTHKPEVYLIQESSYFQFPPYLLEGLYVEIIHSKEELQTLMKKHTTESAPPKRVAIISDIECFLMILKPNGKMDVGSIEDL